MDNQNTEKVTPADRMKRVDDILDEYESKLGLPDIDVDKESIQPYLSMDRNQIEKLSLEDCAEIALLLGGFSFHLQRAYNREIARYNWADSTLKKLVSGREIQYTGSWDSQHMQAVKEDGYLSKLDSLKNYAKQRSDRLTYLASSIKNMSDLFINAQRAKVRRDGN